jgi:uncharacterized protein YbjT (DUF2867 family)
MLLITGATGNVGRELVAQLDAAGAPLRALVRDEARAEALLPERLERVVADLDDAATLAAAFAGVSGLFLLVPGTGMVHAERAVAAAQVAGVEHVVLLSSYNVLGDPIPAMGRWHHAREELVRASGLEWTFLRPTGYMTNALEWLPTLREGGFVLDPTGPGRHALIDPADIASVASRALTEDGHRGAAYALSGGEAHTVAEQVAILAAALGRDIAIRQAATPADAVRFRYPNGAPRALTHAIIAALSAARADTVGFRTDTVATILGRSPATFTDWCARNAVAFDASLQPTA